MGSSLSRASKDWPQKDAKDTKKQVKSARGTVARVMHFLLYLFCDFCVYLRLCLWRLGIRFPEQFLKAIVLDQSIMAAWAGDDAVGQGTQGIQQ